MKKSLVVLFWIFVAASMACSLIALVYIPAIAGTIIFGATSARIGYIVSVSDLGD